MTSNATPSKRGLSSHRQPANRQDSRDSPSAPCDSPGPTRQRIGRPFLALFILAAFVGIVGAVVVWLASLPSQTAWRLVAAASTGGGVGLAVVVIGRQLEVGGLGVSLVLIGGVALCGLAFPHRYDAYILGLIFGAAAGLGGGTFINALLARIEWSKNETPPDSPRPRTSDK